MFDVHGLEIVDVFTLVELGIVIVAQHLSKLTSSFAETVIVVFCPIGSSVGNTECDVMLGGVIS